MSRPRGDHATRRDEIALAAGTVIASRGLEHVTLREIAEALGVTTGVLTHYFPSKEALLRHTKDRAFDRSFERARAVADGPGPADIARLHAVVAEMLPLDRERRTLWRLLLAFYGSAVGSAQLRRTQERRMGRWYGLFREVVAQLAASGAIPSTRDPERMGMAVALFVEGLAIQLVMTTPEISPEWQESFAREHVERLVGRRP